MEGFPVKSEREASPGALLAFIGGGQMATALAGGLIGSGWSPDRIIVIDPDPEQCARLRETLAVRASHDAIAELGLARVVIWATKPQALREAIVGARPHLADSLHISIAAGVSSTDLATWLKSDRVIRAMPNTPALIGAGVTGLLAGAGVTTQDRELATVVLGATGYSFWVESDERIDAVTAVSGSGPAYVFHFLEALQSAAQALGFDARQARELALKTAVGAVQQASRGQDSFADLRMRVTSKRGTTEAALAVLDRAGTSESLGEAIRAAYDRAGELSRELGQAIRV